VQGFGLVAKTSFESRMKKSKDKGNNISYLFIFSKVQGEKTAPTTITLSTTEKGGSCLY